MQKDADRIEPIALDSNSAAQLLGISTRSLYNLTHPRGPLRSVRIGRLVRYTRDEIDRFLRESGKGE